MPGSFSSRHRKPNTAQKVFSIIWLEPEFSKERLFLKKKNEILSGNFGIIQHCWTLREMLLPYEMYEMINVTLMKIIDEKWLSITQNKISKFGLPCPQESSLSTLDLGWISLTLFTISNRECDIVDSQLHPFANRSKPSKTSWHCLFPLP